MCHIQKLSQVLSSAKNKKKLTSNDNFNLLIKDLKSNLYNKRACPTKKEPQQGFLYLTKKMSLSEKLKSNAKTSTSTGILFLFYYFLIKSYLKELLRM